MTAKPWVVVAVMAMMCLMPYQSVDLTSLSEDSVKSESSGNSHEILLMGNSYVASNSLHNLVDGVMNAASQPANVSTLNGGGMRLSQHASNVASAGHQWNTTLNNGNWDWVVLQDQSQIPGFPRNQNEWIASKDGAVELAEVIEDNGGETVLMMTWGRRDGDSNNAWRFPDFSTMQDELESGYLDYRDNISANGGNAWVAPVGLAFEHIHDKIVAEGGTPTNSGNTFYNLYTNDGSHPSLSGSYLAAVVIYATITGNDPVGLSHTTSLSNGLVLELQQAAAATVFNKTSHLDYPWQTNTGGGSNGPSISIPANQTLAWDSAFSFGASRGHDGLMDIISNNGNTYSLGYYSDSININSACTVSSININNLAIDQGLPFVAKFDNNGSCMWMSGVNVSNPNVAIYLDYQIESQIAIDSNENIYLASHLSVSSSSSQTLNFGNISISTTGSTAFLAKLDSSGTWQWVEKLGIICPCNVAVDNTDNVWTSSQISSQIGGQHTEFRKYDSNGLQLNSTQIGSGGNYRTFGLATDSSSNLYFIGAYVNSFSVNVNGNSQNIVNDGGDDLLIGKMNSQGDILWIKNPDNSPSDSRPYGIDIHNDNEIYITGLFYSDLSLGNFSIAGGGTVNGFLAKINSTGEWQWLIDIDCSCTVILRSLAVDVSGNPYISGTQYSGVINFGNGVSTTGCCGSKDALVAKFDSNGLAQWARSFGGPNEDIAFAITSDKFGRLIVGGIFGETANIGDSQISTTGYSDIFIARMSIDYDGDDIADVNDIDDDGDFIHDPLDSCHYSPIGFRSTGSSDHDSDGCDDETEDNDDDNDQLNDTLDSCPKGMTGWIRTNASDLDDDGCMDALEDYDDDNDGFEDYEDYCSRIPGNSTFEFEKGCPDADGDGRPDILDPFKDDVSEWSDTDGDGVGDNSDVFPLDATQQYDTDGDTYGDEEFGNAGDSCPTVFGNSTIDRYGCLDTDGDGWSDEGDDFPLDPTEYLDSDSDGYPDSRDDFPFDPTQWKDSDGDGYGDNPQGNLGDAYPNDASRYADSDRDGIDDQADAFPYDPTQWEDADGDGMGDNPMGIGADKFPDDPTQWGDIDGDGYGDNSTGNNPDAFPTDATQWSDIDGDGYGDNPAGRLYDLFPENPTQWEDADGDGLGDNQSGTDADPYLNDFDNDGYNDTIDILPRVASPGDLDADGCLDGVDAFWDNPLECLDTDGDTIGDNSDSDDDNDEWTDADEIRAGTDPLDPNSTPVDSFEIQIGNIGLGAWDLIGIFGGVPIFAWIAFGFVTRNKRCARFEELLNESNSRDELEQVALRWEYSLMLRLLGPHQGIRLERLRSELDDKFENAELLMAAGDFEPMTEVEQAPLVEAEQKDLPHIDMIPTIDIAPDQTDEFGYSWLNYNGENWYRGQNDTEWTKHEE